MQNEAALVIFIVLIVALGAFAVFEVICVGNILDASARIEAAYKEKKRK